MYLFSSKPTVLLSTCLGNGDFSSLIILCTCPTASCSFHGGTIPNIVHPLSISCYFLSVWNSPLPSSLLENICLWFVKTFEYFYYSVTSNLDRFSSSLCIVLILFTTVLPLMMFCTYLFMLFFPTEKRALWGQDYGFFNWGIIDIRLCFVFMSIESSTVPGWYMVGMYLLNVFWSSWVLLENLEGWPSISVGGIYLLLLGH